MPLPKMRLASETATRNLPRKVSLTKAFIERLECPEDEDVVVVHDTNIRGLCIRVTKGNRSFFLYRKVNGRPMRLKLGSFPDISVEIARKAAQKNLGEIVQGKDPREERKAIRDS